MLRLTAVVLAFVSFSVWAQPLPVAKPEEVGMSSQKLAKIGQALKKEVDAALSVEHFKDFKASLLSRPLQEWYQEQQEILGMLPTIPK